MRAVPHRGTARRCWWMRRGSLAPHGVQFDASGLSGVVYFYWPQFETTLGPQGRPRVVHGQRCGTAADHWNRYREDIRLLKEMHLNAFRFSVEWSKIEPEEGVFVDSVLDHYERVVDELRANGIEPFITLHHFTNPLWFERKGGFERDDSPEILARFASKVVQRLGSKIRFWSTINEPNIYAVEGYYNGTFRRGSTIPRRLLNPNKILGRLDSGGTCESVKARNCRAYQSTMNNPQSTIHNRQLVNRGSLGTGDPGSMEERGSLSLNQAWPKL